jgi:hypothetical protein
MILASALVVGFLLVRRGFRHQPVGNTVAAASSTLSRREVVLVYLGDVNCPICRSREFTDALEKTIGRLRAQVTARGEVFRAVGVIITEDLAAGYSYLRKHGNWDEISVGGGWLNTLSLDNVWSGASKDVVPQVVVYAQMIHWGQGLLLASDRTPGVTITGALELRAIADSQAWDRLLPSPLP